MGETTYNTIGRPLPGRKNIVISRDTALKINGAQVVNDITSLSEYDIEGTGVVMGGAQIYKLLLPMVDTIVATEVDGEFEADTYLEPLDASVWSEQSRTHHKADAENKYDFDIVEYQRVKH